MDLLSFIVGVASGAGVSYVHYSAQPWAIILKSLILGCYLKARRAIFHRPMKIGVSAVSLVNGICVTFSKHSLKKSTVLSPKEIMRAVSFRTFFLTIELENTRYNVWSSGALDFRADWPFNQKTAPTVKMNEREGITCVIVTMASETQPSETHDLTTEFVNIDGPFANFGGNIDLPLWVALDMMLPTVCLQKLQSAKLEVGTIHGNVQCQSMQTLNELNVHLVNLQGLQQDLQQNFVQQNFVQQNADTSAKLNVSKNK